MSGGASDNSDDEITGINVTPLVDVMLVLLIIFMVTATYIANQAIGVNLPKAATGEDPGAKNLAFVLDKEEHLFLNGAAITYEALPQLINEERSKKPDLQALISADRETPHGAVIKLIDVIRKNGITEFAINVESM